MTNLFDSNGLMRRAGLACVGLVAATASAQAQCVANVVPTGIFGGDLRKEITDYAGFARASVTNSIITTMNSVHLGALAQSGAYVGSPSGNVQDQQGAGSWNRIVGGSTTMTGESHAKATSSLITDGSGNTLNPPQPVAGGTVNCSTKVQQDFFATQFGFDLARHNFGGGKNFHLGLTGGYTDVTTKDKTPGSPDVPGSEFSSKSQIPFGGIYAALYSGALSVDAQIRWDFIRDQLTDPQLGMSGQEHSARSTSFLFNVAYRHELPNRWFVEPSIGGIWSRTEVDSLSVPGEFSANTASSSLSDASTLRIQDVQSSLGRVSLRAGTVITSGNIALQPFAVASLFHEFAGDVHSSFAGDHRLVNFGGGGVANGRLTSGDITTSRVGTYGHIGLGVAGTIIDTGWSGYARVDYRSGENIESVTANAGLRYQFNPPRDIEAGLKDSHAPAAITPDYRWTGLHVGLVSGSMWGQSDWNVGANATTNPNYSGAIVGGQIGYDHQIGNIVLGAAADYSYANGKGGQSCPDMIAAGGTPNFLTCEVKVQNLGFVTGRLGYSWHRAMVYTRGGLAFGDVTTTPSFNLAHVAAPYVTVPGTLQKETHTQVGWVWGAGMEFAFSDRWSGSVEYFHYDLGSQNVTLGTLNGSVIASNVETSGDVVRAGLSYRFGH